MNRNFLYLFGRRQAILAGSALLLATAIGRKSVGATGTVATFIEQLGDKAILQLADPDISDKEREDRFRRLLHENFDVPRITRFVLGRYARKVTDEQFAEFSDLYEDIAVLTYAHLFASYAGQSFKIKREVGDPGDRYKLVMTEVLPSNGKPPVKLDWQVKVNGESYAVVDIRVEGASMAITQREEFTAVLDRNSGDIDDLLGQLKARREKLRDERGRT